MTIRDYIKTKVFDRRVKEHGCLVIYDPVRRYRELALEMEDEHCKVIDVSRSVISQREAASDALSDLAAGRVHNVIIWVPAKPPETPEDKEKDPFCYFADLGVRFPSGDGDDYASLCRKAKVDHLTEINRLFEEGEPSFDIIDALDQGGSWPKLKTLLGVQSAKEILLGLLAPKDFQEAELKSDASWVMEAREFIFRCLGHTLKTKGQMRKSVADELWRLLLFSEFAFDSAGDIAKSLETVPRVNDAAKTLVYDVCDELRKHQDYKDGYREAALEIERELNLAERSKEMRHLGERDTFSFEERIFLDWFVEKALSGELEAATAISVSRRKSIWLSQEERLAEWTLAARALDLLEVASRLSAPKFTSLESIIQGYATTWRELDRSHREMEQSVNLLEEDHDGLESLVKEARTQYFKSVEALQAEFIRLVAAEGWPVTGGNLLWNSQVFTKVVSPVLESGERVAYFLVDSLRYELGVELEKQLSDKLKVDLRTVCAQLPTYTEVGMASLMPDAESNLKLVQKDGKLATTLGGNLATAPATRFAYLKSRKGDQCADIDLDDLIRQKKPKVDPKVKLLVVRTRDIDSIAHESPHQVLHLIPELVRQVMRGLNKAGDLGFTKAVIATDHGFILWHEQEAGNLATRPPGTWLISKSRCMLGAGQPHPTNLIMKGSELGIPGEFEDYAAPRSLVPYARGQMYYHEGLSLQECVLPCLTVTLESSSNKAKKDSSIKLILAYRQGKSDRITTRRPVVDLCWPEVDLFADDSEQEVVVEACDAKGIIVGWASSGATINAATGGVRIKPGAALAVGLRMDEEFSGNFTVRALDPSTNALLAELTLKTAYIE